MKSPSVLMIGDSQRESRAGLLVRHVHRELRNGGAAVNIMLPGTPAEYASHAAAASDAVIVVARERNASYSGTIKTLLDSVDTDSVLGKPFGFICYSESHPAPTAVDHLKVVVSAMKGVPVLPEVCMSLRALPADTAGAGRMSREAAASISALISQLLRYSGRGTAERHQPLPVPRPAESDPEPGCYLAQPVTGRIYESIAQAVAYIKENFSSQNLSLDTVASAVYMSRYHFSRKFREETGRRFIDYLIMLRMTEARKLLIETNWTVTTIAAEVGYRDLSNFERSFKKMFGTQPSQYRRRYASSALDRRREPSAAPKTTGKGATDFRILALQLPGHEVRGPAGPRPGRRVAARPAGPLQRLAARAGAA